MFKKITITALFAAVSVLGQQRSFESVRNVGPAQFQAVSSGLQIASANLPIAPGDLLDISVFDIPELAAPARVSNNGEIDYALLGNIKVAGMNTAQAARFIEGRLRESKYVLDPHVTVLVREYASEAVSVLGEVHRPGTYPLLGTHTLLDVISAAGGLTPYANNVVTVTKPGSTAPTTFKIDTEPGQSWKANPLVEAGDRIEVARAGVIYVLGDVSRAGGFVVENGQTMTVLRALALAAGANRTATLSKTRLLRKTSAGIQQTPIPLKALLAGKEPDMELQDNDVLFVPGSSYKNFGMRAAETLFYASTSTAIYAARY